MLTQLEIQLIASLVAIACAIPGTFLVLRKMAMISDAISHSILPGIVIGFFISHDLNSPLLILFAALTGIITVVIVEYIQKTGLVKEDDFIVIESVSCTPGISPYGFRVDSVNNLIKWTPNIFVNILFIFCYLVQLSKHR